MFSLLRKKIEEKISITDQQFDYCKGLFIQKKVLRKQYLLQEGDVCKYTIFIESGLLRSYTFEKGEEQILEFGMEGWWMADLASFLTGEPSPFNIQAIEASEVLLITKPSYDELLEKLPVFERFFRILVQNKLIATQKRLIGSMTESAELRYKRLLVNFPDCLERVPLHMVASYLGISRETLSRLRSLIAKHQV